MKCKNKKALSAEDRLDLITTVENKPYAVVLFAGGGGVECGMIDAGIEPVLAVEYDPGKPELSKAITDSHEANFPRCKVLRRTVSECAALDFDGFPREPDILWASPVCANFSAAKNGEEQVGDVISAKAIVAALTSMRPKHFFLENVTAYQKSFSWRGLKVPVPIVQTNQLNPKQFFLLLLHPGIADIYAVFVLSEWVFFSLQESNGEGWRGIESHLTANGYQVASSVVDMSDYGVPQARVRFIVRAYREGKPLPLPFKQPATGWYDAIADLIPKLPESQLLKGQQKSVDEFLKSNQPTPLLIDRSGGRGKYRAVPSHKSANTIMRSHFTDGKGANRTKFADIWLPDGTVKSASIECMARLQSFPDWYQFPEQVAIAGSILGYSVPPKFVELLLGSLESCTDNHKDSGLGISFGKTCPQLLAGKTVTRRIWKDSHAQKFINAYERSLRVQALDKDLRCGGRRVGWLFLTEKPYQERLTDMPESDLVAEGFPGLSRDEFVRQFFENKADTFVWVIRFDFEPIAALGESHASSESDDGHVTGGSASETVEKEFWVTVAASHDRPKLMPLDLCYLFPASSFWNRSRAKIKSFPRCPQFPKGVRAAADSGGYVATFDWGGRYPYTPAQYVEWLEAWNPKWAATMDYCCEEPITGGDRRIIQHRQKKTTKLAWLFWNKYRECPWQWIPTVQGWDVGDYVSHAKLLKPLLEEMRSHYGEKFKVGIGTLCARASNEQIKEIVEAVSVVLPGFKFHLWGVKLDAAPALKLPVVASFDSAAWDGLAGVRSRQVWEEEYKGKMTQREYSYNVALPKYLASLEEKGVKVKKFSRREAVRGQGLEEDYSALSIAEIRRDGGTQPREKLDLAHINILKEAIEDGAELDPVVVFYDGESYWLADGFHRCKATEESGFEDIHVIIHQGTRRDAILYSVGANAEHKAAKPRSRADKRRAVMMLLNDPEWSKWSDREIARQCKVSKTFISNQRKSLTGNVASETLRTYTTKHGTTAIMQVGNIGNANKGEESEASASDDKGNGNGINRPANRWYGGKWRIGKWIASHFPEHKIYVEPFGGMWSVGLQKPQSEVEVYNDIHPGATNFWLQLRDNSEQLISLLDVIDFNEKTVQEAQQPSTDPVECAVKFYIQCRIAYAGGGTGWASGYSPKSFDKKENSDQNHLVAIAKRIKNLQIHAQDALDIIREFDGPDTLFYCDPPYLKSICNSHVSYEYEFDRHEELIALLGSIQGKAIISGYPSQEYASLLSGWSRKDTQGMTTSGKDATESIWIKPAINPDDYVIAFLSNLDSIKTDLLREARSRIDTKLNREGEVDLNETVKGVVENADRFSADEVRLMIEVLKTHQAD